MKEGLLWFDNDPKRDVADKVGRAAARYQTKFGRQPTILGLDADRIQLETKSNSTAASWRR